MRERWGEREKMEEREKEERERERERERDVVVIVIRQNRFQQHAMKNTDRFYSRLFRILFESEIIGGIFRNKTTVWATWVSERVTRSDTCLWFLVYYAHYV